MTKFRNIRIAAAVMTAAMIFTGCSLPFFKKASRLSPENVCAALGEYDAEEYDDIEEFTEDLGNKRTLLAGMFMRLEDKAVRKVLNSDEVDEIYSSVAEELVKSLYSKSIEESVLFIQKETDDDNGQIMINIVSSRFGSEDDAWKYYKSCNEMYSDMTDAGTDADLERTEDGDLECTTTKIYSGKSVVSYSVSIEGDSVMVFTGYAYKNNDLTARMAELSEAFSVPAPDVSKWDLNLKTEVEDRIDLLVDAYDIEMIDPADFDRKNDDDTIGAYGMTTNDVAVMEDLTNFDEDDLKNVESITSVYVRSSYTNGWIAISFKLKEGSDRDAFMSVVKEELIDENIAYATDSKDETIDGIRCIKSEMNMIIDYIYAAYQEEDMIYVIASLNSDANGSSQVFYEITDTMELPRI
ncbi:hypothetical protein SAMN02910456_00529 [Ruminococcaceae bacterium YRB3002]|nr:hypothetical protein SAMN02910456_00529 [Ruminococcaceae bacterium YRB3002]